MKIKKWYFEHYNNTNCDEIINSVIWDEDKNSAITIKILQKTALLFFNSQRQQKYIKRRQIAV